MQLTGTQIFLSSEGLGTELTTLRLQRRGKWGEEEEEEEMRIRIYRRQTYASKCLQSKIDQAEQRLQRTARVTNETSGDALRA